MLVTFGKPVPIWVLHHYVVLLPNITGRGVKYTHDIRHTVLHSDRGPRGLCVIPTEHTQKKVKPHTRRHKDIVLQGDVRPILATVVPPRLARFQRTA